MVDSGSIQKLGLIQIINYSLNYISKEGYEKKALNRCSVFVCSLTHKEIDPEYTGVLNGLKTIAGTIAAIIGTVGVGFFVELVGSFKGFLWLASFLYILAAPFLFLFSTAERINFNKADA